MARKEFTFQNFIRGLRRDSSDPEDMINSLYDMKNYKLKHTSGMPRLIIRNGYEVWNTTALPAPARQLYMFTNQTRDDMLMAVSNSKWYRLNETTAHDLVKDEASSVPVDSTGGVRNLPIITVGNRCMFATDNGWYWTDLDSIYSLVKSFQVGIDPPSEGPGMRSEIPDGVTAKANAGFIINKTDHRKIAFRFQLSQSTKINTVKVTMYSTVAANKRSTFVKMSIYTDNAGEPSNTLVDPNAISQWRNVNMSSTSAYEWRNFNFTESFELSSATTYWAVIEANSEYYNNFFASEPTPFYVAFGSIDPAVPVYGVSKRYNLSEAWVPDTCEMQFKFSGLLEGRWYDYVITFYNSTYGIESRPSEFARIKADTEVNSLSIYPVRGDTSVDKVRLYRRMLEELDPYDLADEDVIDTYKYVGECDYMDKFYDTVGVDALGGELQTYDHYRIGETDEEDPHIRSSVTPKVAVFWKGRVWIASNCIIYFSKKLEEDGASGLAGDPIPDYFPPENQIDTSMTSKIIAMKQLGDDQLVIYFANSAIWTLMGMDSTLNPPDPSEYRMTEVVTDSGLITSAGLSLIKSRHAFLSRDGVYIFSGTSDTQYISEGIHSILSALSDDALDNSIMIHAGDELWLGLDTDNDGYIEDIYIYDIQKSVPYWRKYNYGLNIYDMIVKESGQISSSDYHYKTILASDADSNYILRLETGWTDNGQAIEALFETHDLRVGRWGMVHRIELMGSYPSTAPSFIIRVTDHLGYYSEFGLTDIYNSVDVRGHRSGLSFNSPETLRVRVTQRAISADEILGFKLSYNQE